MVRRILAAGLGGLAGLALWYVLFFSYLNDALDNNGGGGLTHYLTSRVELKWSIGGLILLVLGCGGLFVILGERVGVVPSQEQVDQKQRPVSLFSTDDQDRKSGSL